MNNIKKIRHEYNLQELRKNQVSLCPISQFEIWFNNALNCKIPDANAMTLATVSPQGLPSARILLLKEFSTEGFSFFTNYESDKAKDIENTPYGAIVFFWPQLEQQIRIEGKIKKVEPEDSDKYFNQRPIGSRIAALVSPQSKLIENRADLEKQVASINLDQEIKRPNYWGGYKLIPYSFEFWQGRENRLNDRIKYTKKGDTWIIDRLAP